MTLLQVASMSESEAREYLESLRWSDGPVCPHCRSKNVTRMRGQAHRAGAIQCNGCREQFTVTVGSVMESSKVKLQKWVLAFHLLCSSKKGFAALQLQRELGLGSYRTAWFMLHRIRYAMETGSMDAPLKGVVEVDETYVGGKPRRNNKTGAVGAKAGRGTAKVPVMVLVERDGKAKVTPVARVDAKTLKGEIRNTVSKAATILTDEWSSYTGIGAEFDGGHETVNHGKYEYVRWDKESGLPIHTNTAESFFALMKRGHYGVYHQMSKTHLHRYCAEYGFRWDHRKVSDGERRDAAIRRAEGKRLKYETSAA